MLRDSGLSTQDYDVLSGLSAAENGRRCAKDLAEHLLWSPSRLSHHVDRMEKRGLARREQCLDGRGADVVLTEEGWSAIRKAAPNHVDCVRELFIDRLSPRDLKTLRRIGETISAGLEPDPPTLSKT